MRLPLRSLASLALAVGVATCADAPSTSPKPANGIAKGRLAITAVFSKEAAATLAQRSQFADVTFDHVRVIITRPPSEVVLDSTVVFSPTSAALTFDPTIEVRTVGEVFSVELQYLSNGSIVFRGAATVVSHAADQPAPPAAPIVLQFVGPGATAVRVVVAPKTVSIEGVGTRTFTATATDAAGTAVPTPVTWSSSDVTVATINSSTGVLTTTGKRGTTTVTAQTPTNLSDNATVTVTLPASIIVLVSGGGQSGRVGTTLPQPAVVRVTASDNQPIAGANVIFAAPVGGSVATASATTDASGQASTTLTLAQTIGPQSFSASSGSLNVSIPATATAGAAASIRAVSGGGQADTIRRALRLPLIARVTDEFGNASAGVTVSWSTSGGGSLSAATAVTNAAGEASITYTLGGVAGTETITAVAAGATGSAVFTVTALSTAPANLIIVSGNGQTGRVLQPLVNPFVVTVLDINGAVVGGAVVTWTATNGSFPSSTTATDAQGQARNTMSLGGTPGPASATASIAGKSVTFNVTVQAAAPTTLVFRAGPSNAVAGSVITPPVVVEVRDALGNLTTANNTITLALGANPGEGTLSGTLSRAAVNGVATFDDLRISAVATGYTLVASSTGFPSVTSAAFDVTSPGSPSIILVDGQTLQPIPPPPPTVTMVAGKAPVNPPAIKVSDANGVAQPNVTIAYSVTRSGTVIFGGNATTDSRGIITFDALLISPSNLTSAGNYIFAATLNGATGSPINLPVTVVPDAPAAMRFNTASFPTGGTAGAILTPPIQVAITDQYGNVEPNNTDNITIAITSGTGTTGAVLNGTRTRAAVNSVATFDDLSIDRAGTNYTLTASAPTVGSGVSVVSPALTIGAGAAVKFLVTATPASMAPGGTSALSAQLVDVNNTPVATPTPRTVSWAFVNTGVGSINPNSSQTNAQGIATSTYTAPSQSGGTSNIQATDVATPSINGQVTVTVTVPTPSGLSSPTPTNVALLDASQPFPASQYPLVRLTSSSGAPVPGTQITFSFIGGDCTGPSENSSTVVTTDANGNAQLTSANYLIDRTRAHSCIVSAATGSLNSGVISVVILPTTPIRSWIGATSTSWTTPTNWYNGVVPGAGDSVYVSGYLLNRPILQAATTISTLRFESFAPAIVDIASFPLTITGDLQNTAGAIIGNTGSTGVFFTGTGNRTLTGTIGTPVTVGGPTCGTFTLTQGSSLTTADLTVNCTLVIPAVTAAVVSGRFRTQGANGRLQMTPETGSSSGLITAGDAIFDGASESGLLTSGSITVGGNLTIGSTNSPTSFVSTQDLNFQTGNHTITIGAAATPSFGSLYVFNGNVTVAGTGNLSARGALVGVGGSLSSPGIITVQGALGQSGGNYNGVANLVITGATFPEIDGQTPVRTVLTGATITPFSNNTFAGSIEVQGRLVVSSNITLGGNLLVTGPAGEVSMTSSTTLSVAGNVTFAGKQSTLLTSGTLVVGGNFTQVSTLSPGSFAPSAAFITRFGPGSKTVAFASVDSSSTLGSHLGTIDVVSGSSVTFSSRVIALGDLTTTGSMTFRAGFSTIGAQAGTSAFRSGSSTTVDGAGVHIRGTTQFDATGVSVTTVNNGFISIENCPANKPSTVSCPS